MVAVKSENVLGLTAQDFWRALNQTQRTELRALVAEAQDQEELRGALRCFMRFAGMYVEYEYQVTARTREVMCSA